MVAVILFILTSLSLLSFNSVTHCLEFDILFHAVWFHTLIRLFNNNNNKNNKLYRIGSMYLELKVNPLREPPNASIYSLLPSSSKNQPFANVCGVGSHITGHFPPFTFPRSRRTCSFWSVIGASHTITSTG